MEEKELFKTTEEFLVTQACEILKENNINYVRRDEGIGSYLNIAWGSNPGTKSVFVSSNDYDKAIKLIEVLEENTAKYQENEIPEELKENIDEEEMEKEINKYKKMKHLIFAWIPLSMMLIAIIIGIIASF